MKDKLVEVDARKRVSLGGLVQHRYYLAKVESDGTIILTPAEVRPKRSLEEE